MDFQIRELIIIMSITLSKTLQCITVYYLVCLYSSCFPSTGISKYSFYRTTLKSPNARLQSKGKLLIQFTMKL